MDTGARMHVINIQLWVSCIYFRYIGLPLLLFLEGGGVHKQISRLGAELTVGFHDGVIIFSPPKHIFFGPLYIILSHE